MPELVAVSPSRAVEGEAVEISIHGNGLGPRVFSDFGGEPRVDSRFVARLGNTTLRQVRLEADGSLSAVVPEGVAPGTYDLLVVDPWEQEATLPAAFRLLSVEELSELVVGYRISEIGPQRVFAPFPVTVEAVDAEGQVVPYFNGSLSLSDASGSALPSTAGFFAAGRWTGPVEVREPSVGDVLVVRDELGREGRSNPFDVQPREAAGLRWTSAAQTLLAGTCSAPVRLSVIDVSGFETRVEAELPVELAAQPSPGFELFADAACTEPVSAAAFGPEQAELVFHFRSGRAGKILLRAEAHGLEGDGQLHTVEAAEATHVAFVTAPQRLAAGACSLLVTLESHDAQGNAATVGERVPITLSAAPQTGFALFADESCATPLGALAIEPGTKAVSFYFRGTKAGEVDLRATTAALGEAQQLEAIVPAGAERLVFLTAAQTKITGECSTEARLEIRDAFGNPSPVAAAASVALEASPAGGLELFAGPGCAASASALSVAPGEARASFSFKGRAEGSYTVTASSPGLQSAQQTETILPPLPDRLAFVTDPQALIAGRCSAALTVEARDPNEVPRDVGADTPVALASAGPGITFFRDAACATVVASVQLAAGSSRATFYLRGTVAGDQIITTSVSGWTGASQTETITADAPEALGFRTPSRVTLAGECSPVLTVAVEDRFGNVATTAGATVVNLRGAPPEGLGLFSDPDCTQPIATLALPAASPRGDFYFLGRRAAQVTVSATASGLAGASQLQQVNARTPDQLVFVTPPRALAAGGCSQIVAVQSQDALGNPVASGVLTPLALSSTGGADFGFYSDGSCATRLTSPTFDPGSDTLSFYVRGTAAATVTVSASAFGTSASQDETVEPGPSARFAWDPLASPQPEGVPFPVALRALDVYENPTPHFAGTATLELMGAGTVICERDCSSDSETAAFSGGVWNGEVSIAPAATGLRLVAVSDSMVGTSAPFDVLAAPSRSAPLARLQLTPGAVLAGAAALADASLSRDYQTPAAQLETSWDDSGLAPGPAPWSGWSAGLSSALTWPAAGTYRPRVAVRDADGDVAYASAPVVVVESPAQLCVVTTPDPLDDGAAACDGDLGPDGLLSLEEALRLAGAQAGTAVTFAGPMRLERAAPMAVSAPLTLAGSAGVVLAVPLSIEADTWMAGLELEAGLTVAADATLTLLASELRGTGLIVHGYAALEQVHFSACATDCLVDEGGQGLSLRSCRFSDSAGTGLRVDACAGGAPVEIQSTVFERLGTGIEVSCDQPLVVRHATFDRNDYGVVFASGSNHVVESSIFTGHSAQAVTCNAATFASRRAQVLFGNASDGCLSGDPENLLADPDYLFPEARDLRLSPGSPALDSAADDGLDLNGDAPGDWFGAGPDRGGCETE